MAIKKLEDMTDIAALAPGATANRQLTMDGLPRGFRAAALWVYVQATPIFGAAPTAHQPQAQAEFFSALEANIGRHSFSMTNGQDLYVGQEIARGSIYGGNSVLTPFDPIWNFRYPIPMHYLFGGQGEIATRPPTEELEGQSMNFTFTNPYAPGNVDGITTNKLALYLEYYARGEQAIQIGEGLEELSQWGTFCASRTGKSGSRFVISDMVPTLVLMKDRSWSTMTVKANGEVIDQQLTQQEFIMQDSSRFARFEVSPTASYDINAVARSSIPILHNVPTASGEPQTWTKLLDLRNDRSAEGPYEFIADGAYSFQDREIIVIGRRAVAGTPAVRT